MVVYEIEDYKGNTIMAFRVIEGKVVDLDGCDVADEDADDVFNTRDKKVRIQSTDENFDTHEANVDKICKALGGK